MKALAPADFLTTLIEGLNGEAPHDLSPREVADILWLAQSPFRPEVVHQEQLFSRKFNKTKADFDVAADGENHQSISDEEKQPPLNPLPPEEDLLIPFFPATPAQACVSPEARLLPSELLPNNSEIPGLLPLELAQSSLLHNRFALLRLLQPLMRQVYSRHRQWLDENATVEDFAETRLLSPVLRPALEPCFRVIVLLDAGVSMRVWQPLAQELRDLLASSQAFSAVDLRCLDPAEELPIGGGWGDQTTLVLVLSDAAGAHWWDGRMFTQLERWCRQLPVVLLNMLPFGWWARTALGIAAPVSLRNTMPACANRHYCAEPLSRWQSLEDPSGLPLPVITLEGQALAIWAGVAMGDSEMASTGILIPRVQERNKRLAEFLLSPQEPSAQESADTDPAAARELAVSRWQEFQADASAQAQRLLMVMAAAPVLTLPIIRLLLEAKVKDASTPLPMAEVLVSGLLRCRATATPATPQHQLQFELESGVAQLLAERLSPGDTLDVIRAVSDVVERRWNQLGTGTSFEAILSDPNTPLPERFQNLKHGLNHFATVTADRLERLPGKAYKDFAKKLRQGAGLEPADPFPAPQFNFAPIDFECARIERLPEKLEFPFSTAEFKEVPAQLFVFHTSTLVPGNPEPVVREASRLGYQEWLPVAQHSEMDIAAAAGQGPHGISLPMLPIPPGRFLMGSPPEEEGRYDDEGPQHEVELQEFFLTQTPITQAQWRAVALWQLQEHEDAELWPETLDPDPVNKLGDAERFIGPQRPVVNVSWNDAMAFCQRLRLRTGKNYTLPSEAQWEYACRAGTSTPFHFGETISSELANYNGTDTYGDSPKGMYLETTTDVGMFPANAWGLHDMHGNVWEWCADDWHANFEGAPGDGRPWLDENAKEDERRLLRGGSWDFLPRDCRSACRLGNHPGNRDFSIGFRVCCLPQDLILYP